MILSSRLGSIQLRTPLVAASGTFGSVVDMKDVADFGPYGAAVAKSVSADPWEGRTTPRLASSGTGMLNGIGIQNPGVDAWTTSVGPALAQLDVPVWGSAVGLTVDEFARVAKGLVAAGVAAVELNLSCPNLDGEEMWALDPMAAARVVDAVCRSVDVPVGAKLSPNAQDIVSVAASCAEAGATFVTLTNTVWGMGINVDTRRLSLSGGVGGYSGPPIKPLAMRCVWETAMALPNLPIVACGGVTTGLDVAEYLLAGARAVALGSIHFAEPRAGRRILREFITYCRQHWLRTVDELVGSVET